MIASTPKIINLPVYLTFYECYSTPFNLFYDTYTPKPFLFLLKRKPFVCTVLFTLINNIKKFQSDLCATPYAESTVLQNCYTEDDENNRQMT